MNGKLTLRISLCVNAGFGACLIFLLLGERRQGAESGSAISVSRPPAVTPPPPSPSVSAQPEPFRWTQLESSDYRTYVKNLRAIGCPEPSVRAIVTADVYAAFGRRGEELEQKLSELANAPWSARLGSAEAEQSLRAEMLAIPGTETAEIADLLGLKPAQLPTAAASPHVFHRHQVPEDAPPAMPLVLQNVDPGALSLNDDQKQAIASVREDFLAEIGGTDQDATDPAYLARWQKAQPEADTMLQALLGGQIYTEYQLLAESPAAR